MKGRTEWSNGADPTLPRKASHTDIQVPVPQTDTGRRAEKAKGSGITLAKELGKLTP